MTEYREREHLKSADNVTMVPVPDVRQVTQVVEPTRSTPTARETLPSTRFNVSRSTLYKSTPSPQELSVESEFRKYTSGEVTSEETDILWFWEVYFFSLNDAMTL